MKLKKIIQNLEKAHADYVKKYGVEPEVFSVCADDGLLLCSKVKKSGCLKTAFKPHVKAKIGIEAMI